MTPDTAKDTPNVMKWFGDPWPSAKRRAGVCEDDRDRIPVPVGEPCARCDRSLLPEDRGVELPYVSFSPQNKTVVATRRTYHLRCFLTDVLGRDMAEELLSRITPP